MREQIQDSEKETFRGGQPEGQKWQKQCKNEDIPQTILSVQGDMIIQPFFQQQKKAQQQAQKNITN